ncbi:MAG: acyl-[acyl-carrier-protein]--UDP-N-acetylglucosamine O-acyltransferase, partial [Pseudomonadota bacterium]
MARAKIHPTAIVEDGADIGDDCTVGPYCMVGPDVSIAEGCELVSHVVLAGRT